jgi:hypothetical protein
MKRYISKSIAVIIAVACFAFTNAHKKDTLYYWFPLNATTGAPQSVTMLVHQANDPENCDLTKPLNPYCEGAYTSFAGTGPFTAAGSNIQNDHTKN